MTGAWVIGQYDVLRGEWNIRRPFRLWVDEARLPRPSLKQARPWEPLEE